MYFYMPFAFATPAPAAIGSGVADKLFSHSLMKSLAVRFRFAGVRRFSIGGRSSSSFGGGEDFSKVVFFFLCGRE
jgi:hypothetical protein